MSKDLGPKQKKILTMLFEEKKNPRTSFWRHNRTSEDTCLEIDAFMQTFYNIIGTEEEIMKAIQNLDIVKRQKIYNTLKRLQNRGLIIYSKGVIKAYIQGEYIKNLKTGKQESLKRLLSY